MRTHKWKKVIIPQIGSGDEQAIKMKKRIIELEMENEILNTFGTAAIFIKSG